MGEVQAAVEVRREFEAMRVIVDSLYKYDVRS